MQLQPDFLKREPTKSKAKPNTKLIEPIPKVAKLLAKVSKITSDILFDEDEAYAQWVQLRNEILQASADRKKYQLDQGKRVGSPTARKPPSIQNTTAGMGEDEEQFDMMGDLFSSLPETTSDLESGASSLVSRGKEGQIVTIRDFGRWTGMNPRRVFEEACKARLDFLQFFGSCCSLITEVEMRLVKSHLMSYQNQHLRINNPCSLSGLVIKLPPGSFMISQSHAKQQIFLQSSK